MPDSGNEAVTLSVPPPPAGQASGTRSTKMRLSSLSSWVVGEIKVKLHDGQRGRYFSCGSLRAPESPSPWEAEMTQGAQKSRRLTAGFSWFPAGPSVTILSPSRHSPLGARYKWAWASQGGRFCGKVGPLGACPALLPSDRPHPLQIQVLPHCPQSHSHPWQDGRYRRIWR